MGSNQPLLLQRARRVLALLALCVAVLMLAAPVPAAHADNTLASSNPADGSSLASSPDSLVFTFVEPLGPINTVAVTCNGNPFSVGDPTVGADGVTLTTAVPLAMPKGTCNAVITVSALDSAPNGTAQISFTVTADTAVAPTTETPAVTETTGAAPATTLATTTTDTPGETVDEGPNVGGPLGLARVLGTLGIAIVFGSLLLIVLAWPEGTEYILTIRFLRTAWIVGLVGAAFTAVCLTAELNGTSISASLNPISWLDLRDSVSGLAALARVGLAAATGWVVMRLDRVLDQATQLPALLIPGLAVLTLGLERTGGDLALIGAVAGIGHALAMSVWLGGIVLVSRVVLAGPGEEDLVGAVRGFHRIAMPALVVTILTGAVQTFRLDRGALFDTGHGRVMLLKALAVGAMVFVAFATRQYSATRLRTATAMTVPTVARLRRATSIEAAGGLIVLVLSAWLLSLTPANLMSTEPVVDYAYTDGRFVADGLDLSISLTGGVGPNGVRIDVVEPASGLSDFVIRFLPPVGTDVPGVELTVPAALSGTGAAVLPESEGIPLNVAGLWTLQVEVSTASGPVTGQKTFAITD